MVNGYNPTTLAEALAIRAQHPVIPYAGGTDLMIADTREGAYLFLNRIPDLKRVVRDGDTLRLGACCTFTELLQHPETPAVLKEALESFRQRVGGLVPGVAKDDFVDSLAG